jgi:hypothetical protein
MAIQVQLRRGTSAQNNSFTGAVGEVTVNTTDNTLRVHDGTTAGGTATVGLTATQTLTNKTLTSPTITGSGVITTTANITGGNLLSTGIVSVNSSNAAQAITNAAGNGVGNIGSATGYFNTVFAKATSAQYADLAEMYVSDANYEPGTVVSFGGANEITITEIPRDIRIAGVVSTAPSYLMNTGQQGEFVLPIALTGKVPTRVTGNISKGDMMVSAGNGVATACTTPAIGMVIGKSLEDFSGVSGVINIVVGRL